MQQIKTCAKCGGKFVAQRKTTLYCSQVCYLAANKEKCAENYKRHRAEMKMLVNPPKCEFDLEPGDVIAGPDKQLDGDKNAWHKFRVTKVYKHFFEAVRIDKGWERSFAKADYITGVVRRVKGSEQA